MLYAPDVCVPECVDVRLTSSDTLRSHYISSVLAALGDLDDEMTSNDPCSLSHEVGARRMNRISVRENYHGQKLPSESGSVPWRITGDEFLERASACGYRPRA